MRFALVVLFFVALYVFLRPSPPADPALPIAQDTTSKPQPPAEQATSPAPSEPIATAAAPAVPPVETADEVQPPAPAIRSGEADRPGEQRTSQHGPLKPQDIEAEMQKELTRLACLRGKAEKRWGSRSRSALRRFVSRAKPKEGKEPNEALLREMRGYPANYCKLCSRPGKPGCKIGSGASRRRSENDKPLAPQPKPEPEPDLSYLPPWMLEDGKLADVEEKVHTDVIAHTSPAETPPEAVRRPRRPKRAARRPRPRAPAVRSVQSNPPSLNGWPRGY
jgi:hypothetical protein